MIERGGGVLVVNNHSHNFSSSRSLNGLLNILSSSDCINIFPPCSCDLYSDVDHVMKSNKRDVTAKCCKKCVMTLQ